VNEIIEHGTPQIIKGNHSLVTEKNGRITNAARGQNWKINGMAKPITLHKCSNNSRSPFLIDAMHNNFEQRKRYKKSSISPDSLSRIQLYWPFNLEVPPTQKVFRFYGSSIKQY
jgi:hypothetical protein